MAVGFWQMLRVCGRIACCCAERAYVLSLVGGRVGLGIFCLCE
jgi:hypothetical protein